MEQHDVKADNFVKASSIRALPLLPVRRVRAAHDRGMLEDLLVHVTLDAHERQADHLLDTSHRFLGVVLLHA